MSFVFEQPAWAWGALAILLAAIVLLWRSRRPRHERRSWRWALAGIGLPAVAAMCTALATSGAALKMPAHDGVVILLDFSASARGSLWHDPAWVRALAEKRLGPKRLVKVVGFGAGENGAGQKVLLEGAAAGNDSAWPVAWPTELLAGLEAESVRLAQSDLRGALTWQSAAELQDAALPPAPRWVITDGLVTALSGWPGDGTREGGGGGGVGGMAWTILPPDRVDVGVTDLVVRSGSTGEGGGIGIEILARLRAVQWQSAGKEGGGAREAGTPPGVLRVETEILRDGKSIATQPVEFHTDEGGGPQRLDVSRWLSVRDELERGAENLPHRYEVRVRLVNSGAAGDPWPEDDRAEAIWAAPDKARVLVVGEKLPPGLGGGGGGDVVVRRVSASDFTGDLQQLLAEGWQAVVLDDIPAEPDAAAGNSAAGVPRLSPSAAQGVEHFVRDTGGGLLILSNGHAFGPGHYGEGDLAGDVLERLSPVWSHPHAGGRLHVVFLLDASASMNEAVTDSGGRRGGPGGVPERKFRLLAQGVERAAGLLSADDRVTVITFNDRAQTVLAQRAWDLEAPLAWALARVQPGGATVPDAVLGELARALQSGGEAPASERTLVVLVTDGEIPSLDLARWRAVMAASAGETARGEVAGTGRIVALCIVAPGGAGAGISPLEQLSAALPGSRWFKTQDPAAWPGLLQEALAVHVRGRAESEPLEWEFTPAGAAAIRGTARAWTRVWLKPETTLLVGGSAQVVGAPSREMVPLAGVAQRGLGKVAAIVISDSQGATESPGYLKMRNEILSRIAASPGDRRFRVVARRDREGGGWLVTADGIDPSLMATAEGSEAKGFIDGENLTVRLNAPLSDSRLEFPLWQTAPGHYEARVAVMGPLSAVVVRKGTADAQGEALIGRIQTADVQTSDWPAAVEQLLVPENGIPLSGDLNDATMWMPETDHAISLTTIFWLAAVVAALVALFLRR